MAARVCLKSDRQNGVLRVNASHLEPKHDAGATAASLAASLATLARWLQLDGIEVASAGDLSQQVKAEVARL